MTTILDAAGALIARYDVLFCDIWGVVHDGRQAYKQACAALARFRDAGGTVVLISNVPTTRHSVAPLIASFGVPETSWDAMVTSGDLTRFEIGRTGAKRIFHIGTERDREIFDGLGVSLVEPEEAELVVATELVDDRNETPEQYRPLLERCHARGLPFICGNPDLVVHVGEDLLPCAGALAAIYEELGGSVVWCGKPYRPMYERALELAQEKRGAAVAQGRILAIGDALRTDMAGARDYGVDGLIVVNGIHRDEVMPDGAFDAARLAQACARFGVAPVAAIDQLRW